MQTRRLGRTDLNLTTLGLGAWAIGGAGWKFCWGPQDDQDSIRTIHKALDVGINWIDTAAVYGLGHSEVVVGQALKQRQDRPIIATKCGRSWDDQGVPFPLLKADTIRTEIENSLRRLGVETIDLYQMHWPQPEEDIEEAWQVMADAVKAGKIRWIGVCNYNVEQLRRIEPIHPVASMQPPYSLIVRGAEESLFTYAADQNIGVVVYSPMQKGMLTNKFTREFVNSLPEDDHRRRFDPNFAEPKLTVHLQRIENLRSIADRLGRTVSDLALAWTLRKPVVTSAIVGARRPEQIEQTAPAGDLSLTPEVCAEIEAIFAA